MKNYIANFETKHETNTALFIADNLKEAKEKAQFHKRHTPELRKAKVTVKLKKDNTPIN